MRIFKEEQRFTQTWLMVLLAISMITPIVLMANEYSKENSTMTLNELLLTSFLMVLL